MSLYLGPSGKLLVRDGKLATSQDCCCGGCSNCGGSCAGNDNCIQLSWEVPFTGDCETCAAATAENAWDGKLVPSGSCQWSINECDQYLTIDGVYDVVSAQIIYSNGCYELTIRCRQQTEQGTTDTLLWKGCKGGSAPYGECDGDGVYHKVDGCPDGPGSICATKLNIENCGCRDCGTCDENRQCGSCGVEKTPTQFTAVLTGFDYCDCEVPENAPFEPCRVTEGLDVNGTYVLDQLLTGNYQRCHWVYSSEEPVVRKSYYDCDCTHEPDYTEELAFNIQIVRITSAAFQVYIAGTGNSYVTTDTCCEPFSPSFDWPVCASRAWYLGGTVEIKPCT